MIYVATLTHSPERCWAREKNEEKAEEWIETMESKAEQFGVEVHGAYVTPNEHTFYFVLETDEFESVAGFLGPPLLEDHDAKIAPVTSFRSALDATRAE